jgi:hypothetical protein
VVPHPWALQRGVEHAILNRHGGRRRLPLRNWKM